MHENLYWFLAQVAKDSHASMPKVKVEYLSKYYSNVDDPERVLIDKTSVVKVPANDTVVHGLWEKSVVRIISDDEHIMPEKCTEFLRIPR